MSPYEKTAIEAAKRGGALLRRRFRETSPLRIESKGLHDFVTEVDRQAEAEVLDHIRATHPDHTIMAEESAPEATAGDYRWIVDPLDGTTNFIHGVATFAVSVALEDPEGLAVGVIYDPIHDETFHASRGGGAWLNGAPIHCSDPDGPGQSLLATGFPFRELSRLDRYLETFEAFVRSTSGIRRAGSAAMDLAYTACGRYDGFWEVGLSQWDIAAGIVLVREAGGEVTDVVGGEGMLGTGDIVAAGRRMHKTMLAVTRAAFADQ